MTRGWPTRCRAGQLLLSPGGGEGLEGVRELAQVDEPARPLRHARGVLGEHRLRTRLGGRLSTPSGVTVPGG